MVSSYSLARLDYRLRLIAIYAVSCLFWVGFAQWVAPRIITSAYYEQNYPILAWALRGHTVERYLSLWSVIAVALPLAAILHLVIVLFICDLDRKQAAQRLDAARAYRRCNAVLVTYSATFLALTVLSGDQGIYYAYLAEWKAVLSGGDPWVHAKGIFFNAYGPLFNALALLVWVNPLANKLLFAFSYLVYVVWLIKDFAPRRGLVAFSWPWTALWLLNPFPWEEIAYGGYFDILVSLACVAAVHSLIGQKDGISGIYLALGILLKFIPIVILPFLAFNERRVHFRLLGFCVGVTFFGFLVSTLVWGTSTFAPLMFAATRHSEWSIYSVMNSSLGLVLESPNFDWIQNPLVSIAGLGVFVWCTLRQIEPALSCVLAILVTLLFYRVGLANYQMVLFSLVLYWAVSNWEQFNEHPVLAALLVGYFSFQVIAEIVGIMSTFRADSFFGKIVVVFQFPLGCALLVGLVQFRPMPCSGEGRPSIRARTIPSTSRSR
jgi:Glycosyltransferase family 87